MKHTCVQPPSLDELMSYQLGELAPEAAERVEEIYFGCAACTQRLDWLAELGTQITALVRSSAVSFGVTSHWCARAEQQGLQLRSYRLAPGETVACTAAPEDDFVVVRLSLGAKPGESVDITTEALLLSTGEQSTHLTEDAPIDSTSGEVLMAYSGALIRSVPRSQWTISARLRGPQEERKLGPFVLDHTPWEALDRAAH